MDYETRQATVRAAIEHLEDLHVHYSEHRASEKEASIAEFLRFSLQKLYMLRASLKNMKG